MMITWTAGMEIGKFCGDGDVYEIMGMGKNPRERGGDGSGS